jgi:hypothetical protein
MTGSNASGADRTDTIVARKGWPWMNDVRKAVDAASQ